MSATRSGEKLVVYGRMLSPFTRWVVIWARLQGVEVESRPIQVVGPEFEDLRALHGVGRVPILELPSGERMVESAAMCDWLESVAAPEARLLPQEPEPRRVAMQTMALANTASEKAVALVYETQRRPEDKRWDDWAERLRSQRDAALALLDARLPETGFVGGDRPTGPDVAAAVAYDFAMLTAPGSLSADALPRLSGLARRAAAWDAFLETCPDPKALGYGGAEPG